MVTTKTLEQIVGDALDRAYTNGMLSVQEPENYNAIAERFSQDHADTLQAVHQYVAGVGGVRIATATPESIQGTIEDAAITYANGHAVDFGKIALDLMDRIQPAERPNVAPSRIGDLATSDKEYFQMLDASPTQSTQQPDDYRSVINEALVVRHLGIASDDARSDLAKILNWDVAVALDPKVSNEAQALIDQGKAQQPDAGEPTIEMIDAGCAAWANLYPAFEGEKPQPRGGDIAKAIYRAMASAAPFPAPQVAQPAEDYKRMFEEAVRDLAAISEHLGTDPDEDGGADPIIEAIDDLRAQIAASPQVAQTAEGEPVAYKLVERVDRRDPSFCLADPTGIYPSVYRAMYFAAPPHSPIADSGDYRRGIVEAFHLANMINANRQGRTDKETCAYLVQELAALAAQPKDSGVGE